MYGQPDIYGSPTNSIDIEDAIGDKVAENFGGMISAGWWKKGAARLDYIKRLIDKLSIRNASKKKEHRTKRIKKLHDLYQRLVYKYDRLKKQSMSAAGLEFEDEPLTEELEDDDE